MTLETHLNAYQAVQTNIDQAKKVVDNTIARRSEVVKAIFNEFGKGPHLIDGVRHVIMFRGDTYFFRVLNERIGGRKKNPPVPEASTTL